MKKLFTLTILLMMFMVAPMAMADTLQIGYGGSPYGIYQVGLGGEFTVLPTGFNPLDLYSPETKNIGFNGTFQTFCLEKNEYIDSSIYVVLLNNNAKNGGIGGSLGIDGDPISVGTAWLYHEFQLGELAGYNYVDNPGTPKNERKISAYALQKTIWWLEDEASDPGETNIFRNAVIAMFSDPKEHNNGRFPVMAMNLSDSRGEAQDLLVCTPVPEPATMLLLGSGLLGLAGFARRRLKK